MKPERRYLKLGLLLALLALGFVGCTSNVKNNEETESSNGPVKIILDTDFGDDGDDLAALVMLHYMQDQGACEIMAVGQANSNRPSPCAIDVINTYYQRPDIPIGKVEGELHGIADQYSSFLIENYPDLYDLNIDSVPGAVDVYRKVLAKAEDKSIVFVVIGFKKNMSDLLKSQADEISPLTGIQLVEKKVKFVSDMAGYYPEAPHPEDYKPYNFGMVNNVAKYYVENCPVPIIFTGIRTGQIKIGQQLRKLHTPTGRALDYKLSRDGGWGKPIEDAQAAFDCISALIAVKGADEYFHVKYGCNELDTTGYNVFSYEKDCGHSHVDALNKKMSFEEIAKVMEEMLLAKPRGKNTNVDINMGMVAHYPFDGNARDISGGNNHLKADGVVLTTDRFNNEHSAFSFDGSSSTLFAEVINMPAMDSAKTISWWYISDAMPEYGLESGAENMVVLVDSTTGLGIQFGFRASGYKTKGFDIWEWGGGTFIDMKHPVFGSWHHCVYVYKGNDHTFYLDGEKITTSTIKPKPGTPRQLMFGNYPGGDQFFKGKLDDVRVYNRALIPSGVYALYRFEK